MRLKIIFIFLIFNLILFSACAENIIYKVDDGFLPTVGGTKNTGVHVLVDVFFVFECSFEQCTDKEMQELKSLMAEDYLSIELRNYIDKVFFPKYTKTELMEIIVDEKSTLFFDGFIEYIKNVERLSNVKVTSIRMVLR